jgi:predicted small secreted protein
MHNAREVKMNRKMVALLSLIGFAIAALAVAGCNTVEGVGKDVKAGGQAIEKAADKNKTY